MPALNFVARCLAAAVLGVAVFFLSMALTLVVRGENPLAASSLVTNQLVSETAPEFLTPLLSTDSVVVATTNPSPPVVVTTTTIVVPGRTRSTPLPELDEVFDPLVEELETLLSIPVRVPAELEASTDGLFADGTIDIDGYTIFIEQTGACEDHVTCRVATFTARKSVLSNPSLGTGGTLVPLPNGLTGRFTDGTCGTGCNNAFITWIEEGIRYSVGSNLISGTDVLDLAWRSIDCSLPAPSGPELCGHGKPRHDGQVATVLTTEVDADSPMHWLAVCSALGIDLEIVSQSGAVSWSDIDEDDEHDLVVANNDGTTMVFVVDENRPRAVIDLGTSERLTVRDLQCVWVDGQRLAFDAASNELLDFVGPLTVLRTSLPESANVQSASNC